jgi:hypothetical protein
MVKLRYGDPLNKALTLDLSNCIRMGLLLVKLSRILGNELTEILLSSEQVIKTTLGLFQIDTFVNFSKHLNEDI